jgi:hypothetical protein
MGTPAIETRVTKLEERIDLFMTTLRVAATGKTDNAESCRDLEAYYRLKAELFEAQPA